MAIITAANFKTYRGITVSTYDTLIQTLIDGAQAQVERWCDRAFDTGTFTQTYNGEGSETIILRNTPITSITSITRIYPDGDTSVVDSDDYRCELETGVVKFTNATRGRVLMDSYGEVDVYNWGVAPQFTEGHQNVRVVYVGGYGTMPKDLVSAMYMYVDSLYSETYAVGGSPTAFQSETLGDYSYTNAAPASRFIQTNAGLISAKFATFKNLFAPWKRGHTL